MNIQAVFVTGMLTNETVLPLHFQFVLLFLRFKLENHVAQINI